MSRLTVSQVTRRNVLRAGVAGAFGLNLASMLQLDAAAASKSRGKSAIFIFLTGGQAHQDSWDPKPDAGEMKGEFDSIATNVPELRVCEHMPHLATIADNRCDPGLQYANAVSGAAAIGSSSAYFT